MNTASSVIFCARHFLIFLIAHVACTYIEVDWILTACSPFSLLSGFGKKSSAIGAQPKDISDAFDRPDQEEKQEKNGNYS